MCPVNRGEVIASFILLVHVHVCESNSVAFFQAIKERAEREGKKEEEEE